MYRELDNICFNDGCIFVFHIIDQHKEEDEGKNGENKYKDAHEETPIGMGTVNWVMMSDLECSYGRYVRDTTITSYGGFVHVVPHNI